MACQSQPRSSRGFGPQLRGSRAANSRLRVWPSAYRRAHAPGLRTSRLMSTSLSLAFDLRFEDLYGRDGLVRLDGGFVDFLKRRNVELHNRLMAARAAPDRLVGKEESDLMVELAPELEDFIAALFGIAREDDALRVQLEPLLGGELTELRFAQRVDAWMKAEAEHAAALDLAARYAAWA